MRAFAWFWTLRSSLGAVQHMRGHGLPFEQRPWGQTPARFRGRFLHAAGRTGHRQAVTGPLQGRGPAIVRRPTPRRIRLTDLDGGEEPVMQRHAVLVLVVMEHPNEDRRDRHPPYGVASVRGAWPRGSPSLESPARSSWTWTVSPHDLRSTATTAVSPELRCAIVELLRLIYLNPHLLPHTRLAADVGEPTVKGDLEGVESGPFLL